MAVDLGQALASLREQKMRSRAARAYTKATGLLNYESPATGINLINRGQQIPGPAPTRPVMSNKERLIRLILSEAGNQGEPGMRLVASVINNRSKDGRGKVTAGGTREKPSSLMDVISAKNQFTGYEDANYYSFRPTQDKWKTAAKIVDELYDNPEEWKDTASGTLLYANTDEWDEEGSFAKRVDKGDYVLLRKVGQHSIYELKKDHEDRLVAESAAAQAKVKRPNGQ